METSIATTAHAGGGYAPPVQSHEPAIMSAALGLSLSQGRVLRLLLSQPLTPVLAIEDCVGVGPEGRRTAIFRLRRALQGRRVSIMSHPGLGYWLTPEDRARVNAIVGNFVGSN